MSLFRTAFRAAAAVATMAAAVTPVIAARYPSAKTPGGASTQFSAKFEGVGAEGVDNIWAGELDGATAGQVTIRLEHVGSEMDRAKTVWPVHALVFLAADDATKSMITEATGTLDWRTGALTLKGTVTDGYRKGAAIDESVMIDPRTLDGSGSLEFRPQLAAR